MDFETLLLAKFLSFAALLAATIMYAELLKHRQRARTHGADRVTFEDEGLRGLVRVFLGDRSVSPLD
jgi:hypothetical protein